MVACRLAGPFNTPSSLGAKWFRYRVSILHLWGALISTPWKVLVHLHLPSVSDIYIYIPRNLPKPEYLIARSQLTERGPFVRSHSIFDGYIYIYISIFVYIGRYWKDWFIIWPTSQPKRLLYRHDHVFFMPLLTPIRNKGLIRPY